MPEPYMHSALLYFKALINLPFICMHTVQLSPVLDTGIQYCADYEACEVSTNECYLKEGEACHPWLSCKHNKVCLFETHPCHTPDSSAQASSAVTL